MPWNSEINAYTTRASHRVCAAGAARHLRLTDGRSGLTTRHPHLTDSSCAAWRHRGIPRLHGAGRGLNDRRRLRRAAHHRCCSSRALMRCRPRGRGRRGGLVVLRPNRTQSCPTQRENHRRNQTQQNQVTLRGGDPARIRVEFRLVRLRLIDRRAVFMHLLRLQSLYRRRHDRHRLSDDPLQNRRLGRGQPDRDLL